MRFVFIFLSLSSDIGRVCAWWIIVDNEGICAEMENRKYSVITYH